MSVQVKICGTTSVADARLSQDAGADFIGIILYHPPSPRNAAMDVAKQIRTATDVPLVILTVNQDLKMLLKIGAEFQPRALQLHGDESPELVQQLVAHGYTVWKAITGNKEALLSAAKTYTEAGAEAVLVDAREVTPKGVVYGGTGTLADWNTARALVAKGYKVILAGGLNPQNVARAVETIRPWGVDVVTGVEARKGKKEGGRVREFVRLAKTV